jgi:hypothetical protein
LVGDALDRGSFASDLAVVGFHDLRRSVGGGIAKPAIFELRPGGRLDDDFVLREQCATSSVGPIGEKAPSSPDL